MFREVYLFVKYSYIEVWERILDYSRVIYNELKIKIYNELHLLTFYYTMVPNGDLGFGNKSVTWNAVRAVRDNYGFK